MLFYLILFVNKHFFDETKQIIFFNFGSKYVWMFLVQIVYAIAIFFSNPINLFPIYESLYKMKSIDNYLKKSSPKKQYWLKYCLRLLVVLICFSICLFVPNFIKFISFVGSFIFPVIGLYIPILLNYSYFKKKGTLTKRKRIFLICFLVGGILLFTAATVDSLVRNHSE